MEQGKDSNIYPSPAATTNFIIKSAVVFRCPELFACLDRRLCWQCAWVMTPVHIGKQNNYYSIQYYISWNIVMKQKCINSLQGYHSEQ